MRNTPPSRPPRRRRNGPPRERGQALVEFALIVMLLFTLFLGIIGEYLGRLYLRTKRLPLTIIDREIDHRGPRDR